jgi:hypothetical protein
MKENVRLFKLISGEMVITIVKEVLDDGMYVLDTPASIVPIPPQQAGGQQNQIGFGMFMPFSDSSKDILLNPNSISVDSEPFKLTDAYEQWRSQRKAKSSGIILPNHNEKILDFSKLNT